MIETPLLEEAGRSLFCLIGPPISCRAQQTLARLVLMQVGPMADFGSLSQILLASMAFGISVTGCMRMWVDARYLFHQEG